MANPAKILERGTDGVAFEALIPASQPGDVFPAGTIVDYAGVAAPTGWLICDGAIVSRATYPELFNSIGTTFGAGDGSSTFGIPDARGKVVAGKHASGTFATLGATGGAETVALSAAEMPAHTHTGPSHTHSLSVSGTTSSAGTHGHTGSLPQSILLNGTSSSIITNVNEGSGNWIVVTSSPSLSINTAGAHTHTVSSSGTSGAAGTGATGSAGSGGAHSNLQPYIVLNKIIRAY